MLSTIIAIPFLSCGFLCQCGPYDGIYDTPSKNNPEFIKKLLIQQIEKPVRWRESVINMINHGINRFIEIGPGKVLSGLVKRIDRNVKLNHVNNLTDIKSIKND